MYNGVLFDLSIYRNGRLEVVKYLVDEAGSNKEAVDTDGDTALHVAAK